MEENEKKRNNRLRKIQELFSIKNWVIWLVGSFVLTLLVESIHRFSFEKGVWFLKTNGFSFSLNFLIISLTLQLATVVKRKMLIALIISFLWTILALANGVITQLRGTPFMFADFFLFEEGMEMAKNYLDIKLVIAIVMPVVIVGTLILKTFKLSNKTRIGDYFLSSGYSLFVVITLFLTNTQSWLVPINWDYKESYKQQGFAYSFLNTVYPYFGQKVEGYNEDVIIEIKDSLQKKEIETELKPNIIYLQLESFMDPLEFDGVEYSFDPIPTFRALFETLGGRMNAPTYGGGTVRTEFEVLTGMDLELMKPGEIPNNQILRTTAVESLASYLTNQKSYHATAIHNFQGTFYTRHDAYANLGFERYIPLEFMQSETLIQYVTQTDDAMLIDYVIKSLEDTSDSGDFVFAVSTGPHGPYEYREEYNDHPLQVTKIENEEYKEKLQDMVIRYWNLDNQLKRLIEYVDALEQETIIVAYSDHYPIIPLLDDEDYFKKDDVYSVPYAIYSNFELNDVEIGEEIEAYQLSTYVFDLIGMNGNIMNELHRTYSETDSYQRVKELIQYDLLQGNRYCYEEGEEPQRTDIEIGNDEIKAKEGFITGTTLIVNGENFNPSTYIWVNGERLVKPSFLATTQLAVDLGSTKIKSIEDIKQLQIGQVGRYEKRIGELIDVPVTK